MKISGEGIRAGVRSLSRSPWRCCLLLTLCFLGIVWGQRHKLFEPTQPAFPFPPSEYGSVARALLAGHGFADPVWTHSGPTAWVPPLMPWLIAAAFWLSGGSGLSANLLLWLGKCALIAGGCVLLWHAPPRELRRRIRPWLLLSGLLYLWVSWGWFWANIDDEAPFFFILALTFHAWQRSSENPSARSPKIALAIACVLAALSSPILLFAQILIGGSVIVHALKGSRSIREIRLRLRTGPAAMWLTALTIAGLFATAWTLRNAIVLGHFIPIKSNAGYELYQSQVEALDGIPSMATFTRHPFNNPAERAHYSAQGEVAYVRQKQAQAWQAIRANPMEFFRRVAHRVLNAFACTDLALQDTMPVTPGIATADEEVLIDAHLAVRSSSGTEWTSLRADPEAIRQQLKALPLRQAAAIWFDWWIKSRTVEMAASAPILLLRGFLLAGIPWFMLALALLDEDAAMRTLARRIALLAFLGLLPYVLISHYARYQVPFVGLFALGVALGIAALIRRLSGKSRKALSD